MNAVPVGLVFPIPMVITCREEWGDFECVASVNGLPPAFLSTSTSETAWEAPSFVTGSTGEETPFTLAAAAFFSFVEAGCSLEARFPVLRFHQKKAPRTRERKMMAPTTEPMSSPWDELPDPCLTLSTQVATAHEVHDLDTSTT